MAIKAVMAETQIESGNTKEVDEVTEKDHSNPDLKKPAAFMELIKTRKKTV
jgi:hypothetical protein